MELGRLKNHMQMDNHMHETESLELMPLNCGAGEDSWEYCGLQGTRISPS